MILLFFSHVSKFMFLKLETKKKKIKMHYVIF